ncbi:hypothetical protein V9T40_003690 [Parthenolecanium corni]|uniref:Uncharacterized protein n=1 Tax=Parthenolecanium corni TaxID=536013 RepID=A0AAN9Y257_9HEMI
MGNDWCCDKKCFRVPDDQIDGLACRSCGSYSFCRCGCATHCGDINVDHKVVLGQPLKMFECYRFVEALEGTFDETEGVFIRYKDNDVPSQLFVPEKAFKDEWLGRFFSSLEDFNVSLRHLIWLGGDRWELDCL